MSHPGQHRSTWKELVVLEEACCSSIRLLAGVGQMATSAAIHTLLVAGLARDLSLRQVKHVLYRLRDDGQVESGPVDDKDRWAAQAAGKPLPPNVKVWRLL